MSQNCYSPQPHKPLIVKYVQPYPSGIVAQALSRYEIGYIMRGRKRIYRGDSYSEAKTGDIFYLDMGTHYVENIPDADGSFEQIACFYSAAQLSKIILTLSHNMDMEIDTLPRSVDTDTDADKSLLIYPAWGTVKSLFASINQYIRCNHPTIDHVAEQIKTAELIYLIISNPKCAIRDRLLCGIDTTAQNFEHSVRSHIFDNLSIEELAAMLHRSMTSFKKEFRDVFGAPPHRWFIVQRLSRAKLLLVSTSKSVSEIGNECAFPNTSHFIKLFKKEFGLTPALFRAKSIDRSPAKDAIGETNPEKWADARMFNQDLAEKVASEKGVETSVRAAERTKRQAISPAMRRVEEGAERHK